jgi:uncharacterized protein involved in outer membrane biogenesis
MSRRARRLVLVALVAAASLAAGVLGLGQLARRVASREALEARLEELLGRELRLGEAEIRLEPGPHVHLEDVELEPGVRLGELDVDLSDAALLQGRIEPDELVVRGVRLTLVRGRDGALGLGGDAAGSPRRLPALASVEIHDAEITWIDESRPDLAPLELRDARLVLDDLAPGRTARAALVARVGADGARGRIELEVRAGPLAADLSAVAAPASLALVARGLDAALAAAHAPPAWGVRLEGAGTLDAELELRREADGALDGALDLALRGAALSRGALRAAAPVRLVGTLRRSGGELELRATRVEAAEAALGPLRARELAGTLGFARGELEAALRPAELEVAGARLETVSVSGRLRPGAPPDVRDGELRAERAALGRHSARDVEARFALHAETLEVEELRFDAWGGRVVQRGRVQLGAPPRIALDLEAEDLDVAQLAGAAAEGEPTLLGGRAQASGPWTGEPNWLTPLSGQGRVRLRGGALYGAQLLRAITDALVAAVPGSGLVPGARRAPRQTRLESATASFAIRAGRIHSEDIDLVTRDYRVRGAGSLGHDGDVAIRANVVLSSPGVDLLATSVGSTRYLPRAFRSPAIPVVVTGTLARPAIRADTTSLPVATARGLLGLPERALDVVKGAGEVGGAAARGAGRAVGSAARGAVGAGRRLLGRGEAEEPDAEPAPGPAPDAD